MKPIWKWIAGIAVGLVVISVVARWYVNHSLKPKMEAELKARVVAETDGLYRLTYDRLDLSPLLGNATATNIRLIPDTSVIRQQQNGSTTTYGVRIGRLQVRGVSILRLLVANQLRMNTIAVDTPSVRIVRHRQADTSAVDTASGPFIERLAETLSGTRVKRIVLQGGTLEFEDAQDASHLTVNDLNAVVRDIRIDSASLKDTSRLYYAKSIQLDANTAAYTRPDSLYHLDMGPLTFHTDERALTVYDIRYGLTVRKAEFYRRVQQADDIAAIAIGRLGLVGFDIAKWMNGQTLAASALHLDSGSIAIYKDKTQPNPPENKIGQSPHQQLLRLKQPLILDSVLIHALDISFTEVSDQTGKAGTVTFDGTTGVVRNVTNDSLTLTREPIMRLHAQSRVMGKGALTVDFSFDLLDSLGAHAYQGKLGVMSGTAFNRMLTPQLNVDIASVDIQGLVFDMKANDQVTYGTLQLDYQNLNVKMLREEDDGEMSTKPIASFFANRFLLNDSNPDANGVRHTGQVRIERPPSFSFFKMIWRSIREGTKDCIGL